MDKPRQASEINYTQCSIKSRFSHGYFRGKQLQKVVEEMKLNISLARFLPLEIAKDPSDGKWYCRNNRSLYVFKEVEKVHHAPILNIKEVVFSGRNCDSGLDVKIE
ncbi:unnamed protein product [Clavelina lepadiformis]|uniref:Uncharacterized protein n=1 Tax=Clavelina lepadiformis TaxID=159417 RepID=A0ABP0G9E8_CLALP